MRERGCDIMSCKSMSGCFDVGDNGMFTLGLLAILGLRSRVRMRMRFWVRRAANLNTGSVDGLRVELNHV